MTEKIPRTLVEAYGPGAKLHVPRRRAAMLSTRTLAMLIVLTAAAWLWLR